MKTEILTYCFYIIYLVEVEKIKKSFIVIVRFSQFLRNRVSQKQFSMESARLIFTKSSLFSIKMFEKGDNQIIVYGAAQS